MDSRGSDGLFGRETIAEILKDNYTMPAENIKTEMLKELTEFRKGAEQEDDESILLLKFK